MKLSMMQYDPARDYGSVYRLFTDPDVNPLILFKPDHNDSVSFRKWLDESLCTTMNDFMVFYQEKEFLWIAYSYQFSPLDGHCRFTSAVQPEFQNTGVGALIAFQFLDHMFKHYPLRKIYFHVYSYNQHSLDCVRMLTDREEGILREYHYYDGAYHDLHIFAVTRQQFAERRPAHLK